MQYIFVDMHRCYDVANKYLFLSIVRLFFSLASISWLYFIAQQCVAQTAKANQTTERYDTRF